MYKKIISGTGKSFLKSRKSVEEEKPKPKNSNSRQKVQQAPKPKARKDVCTCSFSSSHCFFMLSSAETEISTAHKQ